jgi:hypothetical protein
VYVKLEVGIAWGWVARYMNSAECQIDVESAIRIVYFWSKALDDVPYQTAVATTVCRTFFDVLWVQKYLFVILPEVKMFADSSIHGCTMLR